MLFATFIIILSGLAAFNDMFVGVVDFRHFQSAGFNFPGGGAFGLSQDDIG